MVEVEALVVEVGAVGLESGLAAGWELDLE